MTDKELLLKDLCARLPYGVMLHIEAEITFEGKLNALSIPPYNYPYKADVHTGICGLSWEHIQLCKPYLRPLSSLTQEERNKFCDIGGVISYRPTNGKQYIVAFVPEALDYLNSIHADYRGLIEKDLAIEVTDDNNPYK